jgi:hypothetical protein
VSTFPGFEAFCPWWGERDRDFVASHVSSGSREACQIAKTQIGELGTAEDPVPIPISVNETAGDDRPRSAAQTPHHHRHEPDGA